MGRNDSERRGFVLIGLVALLLLILILALMLGGWGMHGPWSTPGDQHMSGGWPPGMPHMGSGRTQDPERIPPPRAGAPTVRVRMVDFAFQPNEIRVKPGQVVNLELINSGAVLHALVVPAAGVQITLQQGERGAVGLDGLQAGTYEFFCSIPGHREAGMIGRLVVEIGS